MWKVGLGAYFAAFVLFTAWSVASDGIWSPFPPFEDLATYQIFFDLGTSISLFSVWVFFDIRRRGKPMRHFVVYAIGVCLTGSISPLLYLLLRRGPFPAGSNEGELR
jgi:hypothetical protein